MPKTAHYSPFTTSRPGARLYHSTASIWLSVDPLSDKYPSVSPYVYCAGNPVRLVDPDGREIWIDGYLYTPGQACPQDAQEHTQQKWTALNTIYQNKNGEIVISEMSASDFIFNISSESKTDGGGAYVRGKCETHPEGTIYLNGHNNAIGIISHELFHGYQHMKGQQGHTVFSEVEANLFAFSITGDWRGLRYDEFADIQKNGNFHQAGIDYNNHLMNLVHNEQYNQSEFDYVNDNFKQWSSQNWRGKYNHYSMQYPEKSLIKDFYPLR